MIILVERMALVPCEGMEKPGPSSFKIGKGVQVMLGSILWTVIVVLVVLWLIGLVAHIAGGFIHLLLIVALIVLLYNLFAGSRANRL